MNEKYFGLIFIHLLVVGYNATKGGDGSFYIDRNLVISTYNELKIIDQVSKKLKINKKTISLILKENNIKTLTAQEATTLVYKQNISAYSKDGLFLKSFNTGSEAGRWLISEKYVSETSKIKDLSCKILLTCKGKRKSCYNFVFKFE